MVTLDRKRRTMGGREWEGEEEKRKQMIGRVYMHFQEKDEGERSKNIFNTDTIRWGEEDEVKSIWTKGRKYHEREIKRSTALGGKDW